MLFYPDVSVSKTVNSLRADTSVRWSQPSQTTNSFSFHSVIMEQEEHASTHLSMESCCGHTRSLFCCCLLSFFLLNYLALSKCFIAVGSIAGVVGSKCQVPLPARGLLVKSNVE